MNISIRLGHTDSVNSVDRQNFLDVELKNTSKLSHFTDIKETIDQFEQFKTERENCNKYRLILTINPYCTNVLFNTFTEMVYAEGSKDKCIAVIKDSDTAEELDSSVVYGKTSPNRIEMIMNSEYTKPGCIKKENDENYVYHPGWDIFNNHILRNKTFKIVNKDISKGKATFNTIADRQRYVDGSEVTYKRRENMNTSSFPSYKRHLYDYNDILQFENGDAVNANISEENGWYGFINASTIQSRDPDGLKFNELNIGHVMNDHKSCEFIDMYPDRTLFSFNPKYNKYRHRLEYNWEIILTYPYKRSNNYDFIKGGLLILHAKKTTSPSGETIIMFRALTKHGLKRGDVVRFFIDNSTETPYSKDFMVRNIGNLDNEEKEYYFYINDMDFIRELSGDGSLDDADETELEIDMNHTYRFARVVGNVASNYYVRTFKKVPNFKYSKQNFPNDGSMTIDKYISDNAFADGKMVLFDREQYKPAFETTVYTDDATQVVFTDTIDIDNLVDDIGRPITEIYYTLVKTNYGHEKWYNGTKTDKRADEVEFSHCFGKVSEGLKFSQSKGDNTSTTFNNDIIGEIRQEYGDICMIYKDSSPYSNDVTINNNEFLGDIVEFNENECIDHILQPFMHRFNTEQRELGLGKNITYHDIWSDDWDYTPTNISSDDIQDGFFSVKTYTGNDDQATWRPEGYYYQPHYRVPVREFGAIIQAQHYDVNVKSVTPVQADGIYLKITCLRSSNVSVGDTIYLFDDENNNRYEFVVTYLENRISFYISPKTSGKTGENVWAKFKTESGMNWLDVANLTTPDENGDAKLCFRRKNEDIPNYAVKVCNNKYLWRNVLKPGDMNIQNLPEYAYSNDAFYITSEINFFLRRQDPQGWNGLYCKDGFPNDIYGNIQSESNYFYKEESEVIC